MNEWANTNSSLTLAGFDRIWMSVDSDRMKEEIAGESGRWLKINLTQICYEFLVLMKSFVFELVITE